MPLANDHFVPLGAHQIWIDGDSIFLIAQGLLKVDDMRTLLDTFDRLILEQGRLFVLYDGTNCTGIDPNARKLAALDRPVKQEPNLQVVFGIGSALRIMVNMLTRAQAVLSNRKVNIFVLKTEAEARTFFEDERQKIRKQYQNAGG